MKFPVELRFKLLALANQISATNADGGMICYVKQKMFKFKEHVEVFADRGKTTKLCDIKANKVIDWSAKYAFTAPGGEVIGAVARSGMRSLWRAHYEIFDADDNPVMTIREENPWVKLFDGIFGEIPIIGIFTGFFLHPKYIVKDRSGEAVFRLTKSRAFFEGIFKMDELRESGETQDMLGFLSLLMMILLERRRG